MKTLYNAVHYNADFSIAQSTNLAKKISEFREFIGPFIGYFGKDLDLFESELTFFFDKRSKMTEKVQTWPRKSANSGSIGPFIA